MTLPLSLLLEGLAAAFEGAATAAMLMVIDTKQDEIEQVAASANRERCWIEDADMVQWCGRKMEDGKSSRSSRASGCSAGVCGSSDWTLLQRGPLFRALW